MNKTQIKQFEIEQKQFGTEVALSNFMVYQMTDILKDFGVKGINIKYQKSKEQLFREDLDTKIGGE